MTLVGRENVYTCPKCGKAMVTVDVDEGITPMFIGCRVTPGCDGMAESAMYPAGRRPPWFPTAEWEWYRPELDEAMDLSPDTLMHVQRGGLLLRRKSA